MPIRRDRGLTSSTTPLPCPKLTSLCIERARAARAFRVPDLSRCSALVALSLSNVFVARDTISRLAVTAPRLQRLHLAGGARGGRARALRARRWAPSDVADRGGPRRRRRPLLPRLPPRADLKAFAASAPVRRSITTTTVLVGGQPQQQQGAAGAGAAAAGGVQVLSRHHASDPYVQVEVIDWTPLKRLPCLNTLSLKAAAGQVRRPARAERARLAAPAA